MATQVGDGIREEPAIKLERIRREVLMAKQELRDKFKYYFRILREKHLEIESQLDEVVRVAEANVSDRQTKLNQLTIAKAEMLQTLQHNELNETVINVSREYDEKIQGLETIVDEVSSVWLEWRDKWLVGGMAELCHVCEGVPYVNRHNPVCSGVNRGEGENEVSVPFCLSTDGYDSDVYVCDSRARRIQVFSNEGIHQRTIRPQGLSFLDAIAVTPHQLFVRCITAHCIIKLDKLSGNIICSVGTMNAVTGLSADTDALYAVMCKFNQICHFLIEHFTLVIPPKHSTVSSPVTDNNDFVT